MKRMLVWSAMVLAVAGCTPQEERDFRQDMRDFVIQISLQARASDPGFIVVPQNGQELLTTNGEANGPLATEYADAINGQGREDLFFGYTADDVPTPLADRAYLLGFLNRAENEGIEALVTDYCSDPLNVAQSYAFNSTQAFASFAAHRRELDAIPSQPPAPFLENADHVDMLGDVRNFLYLLDPGQFATATDFVNTIGATNYDMFIIDAFYLGTALTPAQVTQLKTKANGGRRLVIAYMSIGEAEDYRDYWNPAWASGTPAWIEEENPEFEGNFKVQYWREEWQSIILDGPDAYLNRIVAAGFDGVYLDLIDAFEYFE